MVDVVVGAGVVVLYSAVVVSGRGSGVVGSGAGSGLGSGL